MGLGTLQRHRLFERPARRVGRPQFTMDGRRGELLAAVYIAGDLGVLGVWLVAPGQITQPVALAALMSFVACCAAALFVMRDRLPPFAGDVTIGGSVALITVANLCCRLHGHVPLFDTYYVWVGFAAPMWLPRRRAAASVGLAALAAGAVTIVAGDAVAVATWIVIVVTSLVAFVTVESLTRTLIERERLAAVGEMVSMVSHELRNPLGVITNALFLVRHSLQADLTPETEQHLVMAEREVDKATAIISHLVAFVRPRQPLVELVDLGDVAREVLETTPPPDNVAVRVDVGITAILVDRGHLAEILVNLVSNAYDALARGGTVRIGADAGEHVVRVTVEDDGPGLDPDLRERIFEPFFTTKHSGTGLGLAIVRRLAEINRGDISVTNRPVGGTRFTVTLNAGRAGSAAPEAPRPDHERRSLRASNLSP